jgi:hypothetical protein
LFQAYSQFPHFLSDLERHHSVCRADQKLNVGASRQPCPLVGWGVFAGCFGLCTRIYKVAIAYAVVAWLLMQMATQVFPFFEIPNWAVRLVVLLLVIGFPVAMILAWSW